jgi:hypothetical protein
LLLSCVAPIVSSGGQRIIGGSGCWSWGRSKNWGRISNGGSNRVLEQELAWPDQHQQSDS